MDVVDHKHDEEYVALRGDDRIVMYKRKDHSKRPKGRFRNDKEHFHKRSTTIIDRLPQFVNIPQIAPESL